MDMIEFIQESAFNVKFDPRGFELSSIEGEEIFDR